MANSFRNLDESAERYLLGIVESLLKSGKEGDHWDFKREYPNNAVDLVRDIICLANTVHHKGDRYLIVGVNDDCEVVGFAESESKKQADLIDILRNTNFANNLHPDVFLNRVSIDGICIDVISIKDRPEKPYYLTKEYKKHGKVIHPGTIYSRTRDANTPSDGVAPAIDIEKMWRERLGLDLMPYERSQNCLLDYDGWEKVGEDEWYYRQHPEFTFSSTKGELVEVDGGECWVRAALNPKSFTWDMHLKYHQTVLLKVICMSYDEFRVHLPRPKITGMDISGEHWFYSYNYDEVEFNILSFLLKTDRDALVPTKN